MLKNTLVLRPYTSVYATLEKTSELFRKILSSKKELSPRKIDKPAVLYGAGNLGKMTKDFFDYLGMQFLYVIDKDAGTRRKDPFWRNTAIFYPDDAESIHKKNCLLIICIANSPLMGLKLKLEHDGWKDAAFFYDVCESYAGKYPLSNGWFLKKFGAEEKQLASEVFFSLADDASRAHYTQFLAWRRLRIELLTEGAGVNTDNRFFIPEITDLLDDKEVFVDCGAHHGSMTEKFLKTVKNKFRDVYAIEPDEASFAVLRERMKGRRNIFLVKCALNNRSGAEKFYGGFDFASKLERNGNVVVRTATLDSLKIPATFIKFHLENGELNALKGAVRTIKKYRPIVAVTLYHGSDGAWKIPLFLMKNTKNYRHYIRLHSWAGTGAVFYSIPCERKMES